MLTLQSEYLDQANAQVPIEACQWFIVKAHGGTRFCARKIFVETKATGSVRISSHTYVVAAKVRKCFILSWSQYS